MIIINVNETNFGGRLRSGDILGAINVLCHLRQEDPELKFHLPDSTIYPSSHCRVFRDWLINNTDYLSPTPGDGILRFHHLNIWDYRSTAGDLITIDNDIIPQKKICIFPLLDAPYNQYRNWSIGMTNSIIRHFNKTDYDDYEKYICINHAHHDINLMDFKYSFDMLDNINHITTCNHYVGGDTGMSHFASVLQNRHRKLNYYYGSVGLLHTTPFYALRGKGNINMFWNNTWTTDAL